MLSYKWYVMKKFSIPKYDAHTFSMTDTMIVKGLAIVLLLYHHCFLQTSVDTVGGKIDFFPVSSSVAIDICYSFKLCVGMFVFITGYGLYCSFKKINFHRDEVCRWTGTRLVKTMSGFWFLYVVVFVVTMIVDQYPILRYFNNGPFTLKGLLYIVLDFLGLAKMFSTPSLIGTWWYMSAAVAFIVMFPLLYKLKDKIGYIPSILLASFIPRLIGTGFPGDKNAIAYLLALFAGMAFAEFNLFDKLNNIKLCKNKKLSDALTFLIYAALIVLTVILINQIKRKTFWELHFSLSAILIICFCKKYIACIPAVRNALYYIGRHSMNIYLIHTFFRYVYLGEFLYSLKNALFIHTVLLLMSLAASMLLEGLKKLVRYDKLVTAMTDKINKKVTQ